VCVCVLDLPFVMKEGLCSRRSAIFNRTQVGGPLLCVVLRSCVCASLGQFTRHPWGWFIWIGCLSPLRCLCFPCSPPLSFFHSLLCLSFTLSVSLSVSLCLSLCLSLSLSLSLSTGNGQRCTRRHVDLCPQRWHRAGCRLLPSH
jgi:hypothetical protein